MTEKMTETKTKTKAEKKPSIYEALAAAQAAIESVGKDGRNSYDKYNYRTIDDIMNAAHEAFVQAGVVAVPEVIDREQTERQSRKGDAMIHTILTVRYHFYAADGSSVEAVVQGEGMDRGDKSINKAMAGAYKYCMFQTLAIPTQDMIDSETESPEIAQKPEPKPEPPKEPETEEELLRKSELLGQVIELAKLAGISMADLAKMSKTSSISTLPAARLERCVQYLAQQVDAKTAKEQTEQKSEVLTEMKDDELFKDEEAAR